MPVCTGQQGSGGVKTVFFDVDTQIDFLFPAGALYAPGAETILGRVAALNRFAASHGATIISTMDAHSEDDPEFRVYPHHCVVGTTGQQKPAVTLIENRVVAPNVVLRSNRRADSFGEADVRLLHQREPGPVINALAAERYVVYGVVTEICVKLAAFGLLKTGKRVELVTDAVRSLREDDGSRTLREFAAAGGVLTNAESVMGGATI